MKTCSAWPGPESLSALQEANRQAQRALGVGQEIHGASVTHFDQLGVFRLLSLIPINTADNLLHLVIALTGIGIGLASPAVSSRPAVA